MTVAKQTLCDAMRKTIFIAEKTEERKRRRP